MSMDISNVMKYIYLLIVVTKLAIFPQQHLRQEGDASLLAPGPKRCIKHCKNAVLKGQSDGKK